MKLTVEKLKQLIKEQIEEMTMPETATPELEEQLALLLQAYGEKMHPEDIKMILQYAKPDQIEKLERMVDAVGGGVSRLLDRIGEGQRDRARYPGASRGR